eukprot:CAMPEP_0194128352 /NCGR_PEP_ID=MMETSP0150-20130528/61008_1 /TAXON_ID=122233 /ORGANISM="Chaetoceros debilis, Strain MM31A-1" /LENGTH=532 /DNA_ID=CAMNT_0038822335 /DNA_START=49 /DNA_END=1647 /DNA_ORIENTATION=+
MLKDEERFSNERHTRRQRQAAAISPANFYFGALIGEGLYGKVFHAKYKYKYKQNRNRNDQQEIDLSFLGHRSPALLQSQFQLPRIQNEGHIAIKVMDKLHLMKTNKAAMVLRERKILTKLSRAIDITSTNNGDGMDDERTPQTQIPWIARLQLSFVDAHNLYLVLDLGTCGTLTGLVCDTNSRNTSSSRSGSSSSSSSSSSNTAKSTSAYTRCKEDFDRFKIPIASIRHYAGQVLCAIEFVHSHGIVHGDIKPCNILITSEGRIQLIDFGCAVDISIGIASPADMNVVASGGNNSNSNASYSASKGATRTEEGSSSAKFEFQGTADYLAPEVITGTTGNGACISDAFGIDLWAYGCLIYFMFVGESPFHSESDHITFQKILSFATDSELAPLLEPAPAPAPGAAKTDTPSFDDGNCEHASLSSPRVEIGKLKEPSAIDLITKLLVSDASKRSSLGGSDLMAPLMPAVSNGIEYLTIRSHNFWENCLVHQKCKDSSSKESEGSIVITKPSIKVQLQTDVDQMMDGCNLPFDFF